MLVVRGCAAGDGPRGLDKPAQPVVRVLHGHANRRGHVLDEPVLPVILERVRERIGPVPLFLYLRDVAVRVGGCRGGVVVKVNVLRNLGHVSHAVVIIPEVARGILRPGNRQGRPVPRAVVGVVELEVGRHPVRAFLPLYAIQPIERDQISIAHGQEFHS